MSLELWIALGGLALHAIVIMATGIWRLSRTEAHIKSLVVAEAAMRVTQVGELRHEMTKLELRMTKMLDLYVKRESFHTVIDRFTGEVAHLREFFHAQFDKLDQRIDTAFTEWKRDGRDNKRS